MWIPWAALGLQLACRNTGAQASAVFLFPPSLWSVRPPLVCLLLFPYVCFPSLFFTSHSVIFLVFSPQLQEFIFSLLPLFPHVSFIFSHPVFHSLSTPSSSFLSVCFLSSSFPLFFPFDLYCFIPQKEWNSFSHWAILHLFHFSCCNYLVVFCTSPLACWAPALNFGQSQSSTFPIKWTQPMTHLHLSEHLTSYYLS